MSYKRIISDELLEGKALTQSMIGIGMLFGGDGFKNPNIENTILSATYKGIVDQDYRVLAVATLWLEKHFFIINASRLLKLIDVYKDNVEFYRFWAAVAQWQGSDNRFRSLRDKVSLKSKKEISQGSKFLAKKNGYDPRFQDTCLIVPKKMLEKKDWLVLSPAKMIDHHLDYRWRLIIGPSFRADMWSQLEQDHSLPAVTLARKSYGSYATAYRAKKEFEIYQQRSS